MKRSFSFLLSLLFLITIFLAPFDVHAETAYTSGNYTYFIIDGEAQIVGYNSLSGDIVIPSYLDGYRVTSIGNYALYNTSKITGVVIPNGITSIGNNAFYNCTSLSKITLPDSIEYIGAYAFNNTSYYNDSNNWNNGVLYIDNHLIEVKSSITGTYYIKDGTVCIGRYAFYKSKLQNVIIPDSVLGISGRAFESSSLEKITLGRNVRSIDAYAFDYCTNLSTVYYRGSNSDRNYLSIGTRNTELTAATWYYNSCIGAANHTFSNVCDTACNICETERTVSHVYDNACDTTCNICKAERTVPDHVYDNACDKYCNACNCEREVPDHIYDNACDTTCNICEAKRTVPDHVYDNACDKNCNECELEREVPDHEYDNACDTTCNVCKAERTVPDHVYDNACDKYCNECNLERNVPDHVYDNACDKNCNECDLERDVPDHVYDNVCDTTCNVCEEVRTVPHVYDNDCDKNCNECDLEREVPDHIYDNACDKYCNECNLERNVPDHVYDNACDKNCNECDLERDVPDHVYDNACDTTCNVCKAERTVPDHEYDNACDTNCNICEAERTVPDHVYDNVCDTTCNICGLERSITHTYNDANDTECDVCGICRPNAPIVIGFLSDTVTLMPISDCEYSTDGINWQSSNVFTGLSPATEYTFYQRFIDNGETDISAGTKQKTDKLKQNLVPNAPTLESVTDSSITLVAVEGCEYSNDGVNWQSSNIFNYLNYGTGYTFYQRYKETDTYYASEKSVGATFKTEKGVPNVPNAPEIESKTHNTVTLKKVEGYEYSRDGVNWQTSNVFTDLEPEANYFFFCRKAETETHLASAMSTGLQVKTDAKPLFTIGDVNGDYKIDTTDLATLKLFLAGNGEIQPGADINLDGKFDTTDLAELKLFLAGV